MLRELKLKLFFLIFITLYSFLNYVIPNSVDYLVVTFVFCLLFTLANERRMLIFLSIPVFVYKSYCIVYLDPIGGNDEWVYYNYAVQFFTSDDAFSLLIDSFYIAYDRDILSFISPLNGYIYHFFMVLSDSDSPKYIYILNTLFLYLSYLELTKICDFKGLDVDKKLLVTFYLFSFYLSYLSSFYFKDILATYLVILSVSLFVRKKQLLSLIVLCVASLYRVYSVAIFALYVLFFFQNKKLFIFAIISALTIVLMALPFSLKKIILLFGYLLLSPNPFSIETYDEYFTPQLIESIIIAICVFFYFIKKETRDIIVLLIFSIIIYALTLYAVDTNLSLVRGEVFSKISENLYRKKLPIYPLIIFSLVICHKKSRMSK
ncbi:hypothetical protein V3480_003100 [Vibrio cyclitrophicus]